MKIGCCDIGSGPLLAPMAGVADASFRTVCHAEGCVFSCTEMVSAKGLIYDYSRSAKLLDPLPDGMPEAVQLFGSDPEFLRRAAERIADMAYVAVDFNMGCPVPKVVRGGDGSALMCDPAAAGRAVAALVAHAGKPVTVKIRAGWDETSRNAVEIARIAEAEGACAVTVHGRTRVQQYAGDADWRAIAEVAGAVRIPVIGNGDVRSAEDACAMLAQTRCAAVMIGRAALGRPWLFRSVSAALRGLPPPPPVSPAEKYAAVEKQVLLCCARKGEHTAVRELRKHIGYYLRGLPGAARMREAAAHSETAEDLLSFARTAFLAE